TLLDSYNEERHAVAKSLLAGTDMATKMATIRNPIAVGIRNILGSVLLNLEMVQQKMIQTGSMITVNYRHSKIVGQNRIGLIGPAPGDRAPDSPITIYGDSNPTTLYKLIGGTQHNLLLFVELQDVTASY